VYSTERVRRFVTLSLFHMHGLILVLYIYIFTLKATLIYTEIVLIVRQHAYVFFCNLSYSAQITTCHWSKWTFGRH